MEDLQWDIGEFNQKGTVATRWGTKEEFIQAIAVAKKHGIEVLIDAVLGVSLTLSWENLQLLTIVFMVLLEVSIS
jgi:hypothetical protein